MVFRYDNYDDDDDNIVGILQQIFIFAYYTTKISNTTNKLDEIIFM